MTPFVGGRSPRLRLPDTTPDTGCLRLVLLGIDELDCIPIRNPLRLDCFLCCQIQQRFQRLPE
ncbi:hypothetical protein CLV88_11655 [Shimia abyssi]|uniref:Uncharacterized protein n=1 Tax=Shimia abyssi TaxID=1662395 RepID=A0A2P8F7B5_9RHOB|nr:hypothetical protein CLV88_11655 [Shimia abyssi]